MDLRIARIAILLLVGGVALALQPLVAQVLGQPAQKASPLDELVATLKAHGGCSREVTPQQMTVIAQDGKKIADWIASGTPDRISAALPKIVTDFSGREGDDQVCAGHVLLDVALRRDSAILLQNYLGRIGNVLNSSPDERLQRSAGLILTMLQPEPPKESVAPLLSFLRRFDRDPRMQAAAVAPLARAAPQDSSVIAAIQEFWSRPLDLQSKEAVLNGLGNSRAREQRLVSIVIGALEDPNLDVRLTAVQAVRRMGSHAVRQAEPELRKLASATEEPAGDASAQSRELQIRRLAKQALETIGHP
jgi:hypothetical protein